MTAHASAARIEGGVLEHEEPGTLGPRGPEGPRTGGGGGDSLPDRRKIASGTGILLALAAITMFFAALTSAFLVRKGTGGDWVPIRIPAILWWNTAVLVGSSLCLEVGRRGKRAWLYLATVLGIAFLAGQLVAWRELAASGVYLATNPGASFFYVLTAAHGVHLVGGVLGLLYAASARARGGNALGVASTYWHFMGGLWIYLLLLLRLGG